MMLYLDIVKFKFHFSSVTALLKMSSKKISVQPGVIQTFLGIQSAVLSIFCIFFFKEIAFFFVREMREKEK